MSDSILLIQGHGDKGASYLRAKVPLEQTNSATFSFQILTLVEGSCMDWHHLTASAVHDRTVSVRP